MSVANGGGAAMAASPTGKARLRGVTISDEVAVVLRAGSWEGTLFRLAPGRIDRDLYVQVDKILRAIGGKWNKSLQGHMFPIDAAAQLQTALETGLAVDRKKTLEQFFTPALVAARMCDIAGITHGTHVLEPSAGSGHLIQAAVACGAMVTAVEIDPDLCAGLVELGHHGDVFAFNADFLEWRPVSAHAIDVVLMNPPFSTGKDVAHVRRAWELLAPGGTLVAILGEHPFFADDSLSRAFRAFLDEIGASVEQLPAGTFKESGTMVAARLIWAVKP